jgi:chromosome segregation ATPase
LRQQLQAVKESISEQKFQADSLQKEEEHNADWMWGIQKNYADLEQQMAELDSRRTELKKTVAELEEEHGIAERLLKKEEADVHQLQNNGTPD